MKSLITMLVNSMVLQIYVFFNRDKYLKLHQFRWALMHSLLEIS